MTCKNCKKRISQIVYNRYKSFCSARCEKEYKLKFSDGEPKTLDDWVREATECGLDYGNYRALISMGKTYEQIKSMYS